MVIVASAVEPRKRRVARKRRDEAILDALERLLADAALRDLSVEEIAAAAGVTRTRFYIYFKSKNEALAALMQRCSDQTFGLVRGPGTWFDRRRDQRPRTTLIEAVNLSVNLAFKHREVLREAADLWNALPEVRQIWFNAMNARVEACAESIRRERAWGVAPPGVEAALLASNLVWAGERLQFLAAVNAPGALSVKDVKAITVDSWMRAIYLCDDPDPA